jgi:NAD(P)H dehydrogenase (quinone)
VVEHLHFDDLGPHATPELIDQDIHRIRKAAREHF